MTSTSEHVKSPDEWEEIICRGAESDTLDYKAAQNWKDLPKSGKAKFVRHCLAFANTKGGYIVVGVGEDSGGRPNVYTGLTDEQAHSFDPTTVGSFISRFTDPPVNFTLERPVVNGKCYAVFHVRPFTMLPHVCSATCDDELLQGVFYIRTPDASSRPAYRSCEIHGILQRALQHQKSALEKMIRDIFFANPAERMDADPVSFYREDIAHSRSFFLKRLSDTVNRKTLFAELAVYPVREYSRERFQLDNIRDAVLKMAKSKPDAEYPQDAYFTNTALRCFTANRYLFQFYKTGLVHLIRTVPASGEVNFEDIHDFLKDSMESAVMLYKDLHLDNIELDILLRINGTENLRITNMPGAQGLQDIVCRIPAVEIRKLRMFSDISGNFPQLLGSLEHSLQEQFMVLPGELN